MEKITIEEFQARLKAQGVEREDLAFHCPMCGTIQSARDLIAAGAGDDMQAVEKYLGFSCVGRFTGAPAPRKKPDGDPCNWTLGGLLSMHELAVEVDGRAQPTFRPATPEDAQAHAAKHKEKGEAQ